MVDVKKLYQSFNLLGTVTLAMTLPVIIYRVIKAVYLKRSYNALTGKVVVITGASSGLGEQIAHEFYKQGCQVVLCARRRQELERVRTDLLKMHSTVPTYPPIIIPLDLHDLNAIPAHVEKILGITGRIDILINNGGVSQRGRVVATGVEVDLRLMYVNYLGAVVLTKAALTGMVKRGGGQVVFISSVQGLIAIPERSAYSASKHALQAFADSLRAEVAANNISVTVISAGYIKTQLSINALTETGENYGQMDASTEQGYSATFVAQKVVKAVVQKEKEVVVATLVPRVAIFLRHFLPGVYFYVMAKRARKTGFEKRGN